MALTRPFLCDLYRAYQKDLVSLRLFDGRGDFGTAYHKEERRVLYMMVRDAAPELIVEFSPKRGLSTAHMALALEHNGRGRILSFELAWRNIRRACINLRDVGLAHRVEFVLGDVREELPRALAARADGLEFVFIDSDHGADFARWYLHAVFPCVRLGGLIHVHDILTDPLAPAGHRLPLSPNGEELEVRRFVRSRASDYERLSLADCVRDPSYPETVRDFGGGDVSVDAGDLAALRIAPTEWNPSLWLRALVAPSANTLVAVPFEPMAQGARMRLASLWRQRQLRWQQPSSRRPH